ncbi:hypothetical protein AJ79_08994 [Helicocarpus griseus UAMH5409]|uniref:Uncharacterized protein n=1 Tax=Helicocarpus griseus UAMH5409 TaxID=1447875 RepID=A0A2B7WN62_9EURO|nr:hypothetical protein AJ79_08994 [Helicocarpus griseus UAMH5409]
MDLPRAKSPDQPPAYSDIVNLPSSSRDILPPTALTITGSTISADSIPLYRLSNDIQSLSQKISSVLFERVEPAHAQPSPAPFPEKAPPEFSPSPAPAPTQTTPLLYLVHPLHAQYRTDLPAYYLTSLSHSMPGNIRLATTKSRLPGHKPEFSALLYRGTDAKSQPLFDDNEDKTQQQHGQLLFGAKTKNWAGAGRYRWVDGEGREVAVEKDIGGRGNVTSEDGVKKLVVTAPIQRGLRDALVAAWMLRVWFERAESKEAKREALDALTPAQASVADMKYLKSTVALAGVGGGGC